MISKKLKITPKKLNGNNLKNRIRNVENTKMTEIGNIIHPLQRNGIDTKMMNTTKNINLGFNYII